MNSTTLLKPHGIVRIYTTDGTLLYEQRNQIQSGYRDILCGLLSGDQAYKPNVFFVEFQSSADTPQIPAFGEDEGVEYYQGLTTPLDYLKVPIVMTPQVSEGSVTFGTIISGGTGENGLVCGDSTLAYGAALVATDADGGKVFSRFYFDSALALSGSAQYYITWTINFN